MVGFCWVDFFILIMCLKILFIIYDWEFDHDLIIFGSWKILRIKKFSIKWGWEYSNVFREISLCMDILHLFNFESCLILSDEVCYFICSFENCCIIYVVDDYSWHKIFIKYYITMKVSLAMWPSKW